MFATPVTPRAAGPRAARRIVPARKVAALALAATAWGLFGPARPAWAILPTPTGSAAVDDKTGNGLEIDFNVAANTPSKGNGLSIVGDKVFKPAAESFKIGTTPVIGAPGNPSKTELPKLQALIALEQKILDTTAKMNKDEQEATLKIFQANAVKATLPVNKDFALIKKDGTKIMTGTVVDTNKPGDGSLETATATAIQDATNPKKLSTKGTTASATATVGKMIPNPMAASFALNLDPTAVTWNSASAHAITLDLSNVTLTATTAGTSASAFSTLNLLGAYNNTTTDLGTPITSPTTAALFDLNLGLFSSDGMTEPGLASLSFAGSDIRDSMGGMGLSQVAADLASSFTSLGGGTYGFAAPFSITMVVPGTGPASLLYFDEIDGAAATAVPEPSSLVLCGIGLAGAVGGVARRRKSGPS